MVTTDAMSIHPAIRCMSRDEFEMLQSYASSLNVDLESYWYWDSPAASQNSRTRKTAEPYLAPQL